MTAKDTLPARILRFAQATPDRIALRDKDFGIWQEITWAQYFREVAATGRMLDELGIGPGDHVAIISDNRPQWLYADLGAQGIGARSVGIYQTNPPDDVAYILNHSKSRVLFCEDQEQADKAMAVKDQTPTVERVIVFDPRGTRDYQDDRLMSWEDFISKGRALHDADEKWFEASVANLDPDSPSMVVYTSGTTGNPKGALISSHNALSTADANAKLLGATADDSTLSYLPLCHVAEKIFSLFMPLSVGSVVHFGESIETVREDLREVSPSVFLGVPRIWEKMHASVTLRMKDSSWFKRTLFGFFSRRGHKPLSTWVDKFLWRIGDLLVYRPLQERLGLRNCRVPITGAAPLSDEILRWFHAIGVHIYEGYGMTESAGVSHVNYPGAERLGTVGKPLPEIEQRLAEDGELFVRGENVFCGYLHNADATAETIDEEGWLHTGDIGSIDDDGFLRITGRKKEIIITAGGKNLSPEKIENALKASPYIKEVVAIGDARKFVSALVQVDYDAAGDWATRRRITYTSYEDLSGKPEIIKLVDDEINASNERLARVEQVRSFRIFPKELHQDDGELTATQKVRRRAITAMYGELIESIYTKRRDGVQG